MRRVVSSMCLLLMLSSSSYLVNRKHWVMSLVRNVICMTMRKFIVYDEHFKTNKLNETTKVR